MLDQKKASQEANFEQKEPIKDQSIEAKILETVEIPAPPKEKKEPIIQTQPTSIAVEQPVVVQQPVKQTNATPQNIQPLVDNKASSVASAVWIKKAEEIIKKDSANPYQEEEDHEDLQEEYLYKTYGKKLKTDD